MKVFKVIGIIILVLAALIIIAGLVAPKKYSVERTIIINAPKELVFNHIKYWRNWQAWSPWAEMDSTMTSSVEGADGEIGSVYKWIGNPETTGKGEMTNTGLKDLEEIAYHLHFIEPWESESEGYVRILAENGATKVSWGFYGKTPFPWNIFMLFMSMDKMIGKDFERGLELLKNICEEEASVVLSYEVKQVDFPAKSYAIIQQEIQFSEVAGFFTKAYGIIQQVINKKGMRMAGVPAGVYYSWDEQKMTTNMAAAIPIKGSVAEGDVKTIDLPASKAYMVEYYGPYDKSMAAYQALDFYFMKNKLTFKTPVVEEYITDPASEPDTSKWLTKIYFFAE